MKRAEALQPLSRDHHRALFVALRLRRAEDAAEAAALFEDFWLSAGRAHFRVEEEILLPLWESLAGADHDAIARIAVEHTRIRAAALRLGEEDPSLEDLKALGDLLDGHVRFEERQLFPAIEAGLDEAQLRDLADAVERAESSAGP
jgi:hemerythrin-like domain-containing protein